MRVSEKVRTITAKSILTLGLATAAGGLVFTGAQASAEFSETEQQRSLYGCGVALGGLLLVGTGIVVHPPRVQSAEMPQTAHEEPEDNPMPPEADVVLGADPHTEAGTNQEKTVSLVKEGQVALPQQESKDA